MLDSTIYLDNHATTRVDPRVLDVMWPYFSQHYGNASSVTHRQGRLAAEAVDCAREQVARLIGARPREIVFTSGATEANNLAIKGTACAAGLGRHHFISAKSEHGSVLKPLRRLALDGYDVSLVPCDDAGMVLPEALRSTITDQTALVSVMVANNEVGTINPIAAIGEACRERGISFHTDATQAAGRLEINVETSHIDLLSMSAHKFYGPKGVGALFVRHRLPIEPLLEGGGQERGRRGGTVAVPLVVGMGEAARIALKEREADSSRIFALRERLHFGLASRLDGLSLNGHSSERLAGNLNLSFAGVEGESLIMGLQDIAVSAGSACNSANTEPSHVLRAMGRDEATARASLRFGVGRFTTTDEIDRAIEVVVAVVSRLRLIASV